MNLALTLLTAPRPSSTLAASLASLRAAGFDDPELFEDPAGVASRGAIGNFRRALHWFLDETGADWWLHAEDDTTWSAGARAAIDPAAELLDPRRFGALSLHCMRYVSQHLQRSQGVARLAPGIYASTLGAATRGSQALLFSRASANQLAHSTHFAQAVYVRAWLDSSIGDALRELGLPLLYLLPCLARHELGARNSCWRTGAASSSLFLECDY